jgi:ribonuclease BN (tRNA processing enzyme)
LDKKAPLDLLFLGAGNAFAAHGRAFNAFLLNGRYLCDVGPTVLGQLRRAGVNPGDIDVIFVSHFHGDHFFGLPFLCLDYWRQERQTDLYIVGPPGIEERSELLLDLAFPSLPSKPRVYRRRYIEVEDGLEAEAAGIQFTAAEVEHVPTLRCYAYRAHLDGRTLVYSGDSRLCAGLLKLVPAAEVLVLECSSRGDPVHLSISDVAEVRRQASKSAKTIVTHLDVLHVEGLDGVLVADDLSRFRL